MVFMPRKIAPGTTNTTMFCNADRKNWPIIGIKPRLTMPASIKAMDATKKGIVSLAVKLNAPTNEPKMTKVVTRICGSM